MMYALTGILPETRGLKPASWASGVGWATVKWMSKFEHTGNEV